MNPFAQGYNTNTGVGSSFGQGQQYGGSQVNVAQQQNQWNPNSFSTPQQQQK